MKEPIILHEDMSILDCEIQRAHMAEQGWVIPDVLILNHRIQAFIDCLEEDQQQMVNDRFRQRFVELIMDAAKALDQPPLIDAPVVPKLNGKAPFLSWPSEDASDTPSL